MASQSAPPLKPRKKPVQDRSTVTVHAIYEATIQVLLSMGFKALTTTKVADRAGVSVGTLYQYFPNKHALLSAVNERYLDAICASVEAACVSHQGQPLRPLVQAVCDAFIDAKMRRADVSLALHLPGAEVHKADLLKGAMQRLQQAVAQALSSASDVRFDDVPAASLMATTAVMGPVETVLDMGATPPLVAMLRTHLFELIHGYLQAIGQARPQGWVSSTSAVGS
jgi:AcrR family transcriptional regulator